MFLMGTDDKFMEEILFWKVGKIYTNHYKQPIYKAILHTCADFSSSRYILFGIEIIRDNI